MKKYDYLIVGCGCFGATFARIATDKGKKCLIIDKRSHIAGNSYTEKQYGIDIHKYGAHIFHTSNQKVWDFVNRFGEFNSYRHTIKASNSGRLFSFPINLMTLYQVWGVATPDQARECLLSKKIPTNKNDLESYILSQIGWELYDLFVREYTIKQWGRHPKELPSSIIKRMPVRLSFNDDYFSDDYQGIPVDGYTSLFTAMLSGIPVELGVDFFSTPRIQDIAKKIVYTGPIDQLFNYEYGKLGWRSVYFESNSYYGDHQGCTIINYTDNTPYTRTCEHKHFVKKTFDRTVITKEFSVADGEPFYPICSDEDIAKYNKYRKLVGNELICGGRLGNYKYIDMHQAIGAAMKEANEIL
jgi:UDP-galactopyranose mutase